MSSWWTKSRRPPCRLRSRREPGRLGPMRSPNRTSEAPRRSSSRRSCDSPHPCARGGIRCRDRRHLGRFDLLLDQPDDSRGRVALYLALTMAPFAIVAPLLGPAIDRPRATSPDDHRHSRRPRHCGVLDDRQHRFAVAVPAAFTILVLQKTYSVAKSAVVPALVRSEHDLVGANSRLALISAVSGMVGATVSGVLS